MKKIFAILAMLLVLAGCGVEVDTDVEYDSENDSYEMIIEIYADSDDIEEMTGGITAIDDVINTTFADADDIEEEAGTDEKKYFITYTFDSTEEYNEFITENSEISDAGVSFSSRFDSYDFSITTDVDSSYDSKEYIDAFRASAFTYAKEKGYIDAEETDDDVLVRYNYFSFSVDGDAYGEISNDLVATNVKFTNILNDSGKVTHTKVAVTVDTSEFPSEGVVEEVVEYYEDSGYNVEEKDDTLIITDKIKTSDVESELSLYLGIDEYDKLRCSNNENFLFTSVECKIPEYEEDINVFGRAYDGKVKVELDAFGDVKDITKEESIKEYDFKIAGFIILGLSIIAVIGLIILIITLFKKRGKSVKETSSEFAKKVKEVSTKVGNASVAAAENIKEKSIELNEKSKESRMIAAQAGAATTAATATTTATATTNVVLDSKAPSIGNLLLVLVLMMSSLLNIVIEDVSFKYELSIGNVLEKAAKFLDFDSAAGFGFVNALEIIRIIFIFAIIIFVVLIALYKFNILKISNFVLKITAISLYGLMLLHWLASFIVSFMYNSGEAKISLALSAVLLLVFLMIGLLASIMDNSKFSNFVNSIKLFDFYLVGYILLMFLSIMVINVDEYMLEISTKLSFTQFIAVLNIIDKSAALVLSILFYLIGAGGAIFYLVRRFAFKDENNLIGFILSVYNTLFYAILAICILVVSGNEMLEDATLYPSLTLIIMLGISIYFIVYNIRALNKNKPAKVESAPILTAEPQVEATPVVTAEVAPQVEATPVVTAEVTPQVEATPVVAAEVTPQDEEIKIEDKITENEVKVEEVK